MDVGGGDPTPPPSGRRTSFPKVETGSAQHRWPAGPLLQEAMLCGTVRSRLGFSDRRLPRASCSRPLSHLGVHTLSQRWGRRVLWLSLPCLTKPCPIPPLPQGCPEGEKPKAIFLGFPALAKGSEWIGSPQASHHTAIAPVVTCRVTSGRLPSGPGHPSLQAALPLPLLHPCPLRCTCLCSAVGSAGPQPKMALVLAVPSACNTVSGPVPPVIPGTVSVSPQRSLPDLLSNRVPPHHPIAVLSSDPSAVTTWNVLVPLFPAVLLTV